MSTCIGTTCTRALITRHLAQGVGELSFETLERLFFFDQGRGNDASFGEDVLPAAVLLARQVIVGQDRSRVRIRLPWHGHSPEVVIGVVELLVGVDAVLLEHLRHLRGIALGKIVMQLGATADEHESDEDDRQATRKS